MVSVYGECSTVIARLGDRGTRREEKLGEGKTGSGERGDGSQLWGNF